MAEKRHFFRSMPAAACPLPDDAVRARTKALTVLGTLFVCSVPDRA
jgi:hypothetical protein